MTASEQHIRQEIKYSNLPEAVLYTTLRKLGQLPLNQWVMEREFEHEDPEDGPSLRGLLLRRGKLTAKKHRQIWHRFAAELVMSGQGVQVVDLGTLAARVVAADPVLIEWAELDIGHLFVDHFWSPDLPDCPFGDDLMYGVKTFLYGWMERGRAVYPYIGPETDERMEDWWGPEFINFMQEHVATFELSGT